MTVEATGRAARPSATWWLHAIAIPALIGCAVGAVTAIDPIARAALPLPQTVAPYLLVAVPLILLAAVYVVARYGQAMFAHRDAALVLLLVGSGGFSGINRGPLDPTDVAFLICCFAVAAMWLYERRAIVTPLPVLALLLALTTCSIASIINGGISSIIGQHQVLNKIIAVILLTNVLGTERTLRIGIRCLVGVAIVTAVVGIASELLFLATGYPLSFDDAPGFQFKSTPLGQMLRATAFLPTTQSLAQVLLVSTAIFLFLPMPTWRRVLGVALSGVCIGCTFNSGSYTSFAFVVFGSLFLRHPQRSIHYAMVLLGAAALLYFAGFWQVLGERVILAISGASIGERIEHIRIGFEVIERHPFLGLGLRNIWRVLHTPIHQTFLHVAAELGVPAALTLIALTVYLLVGSAWIAVRAPDARTRMLMKGMFLGMAAQTMYAMIEPLFTSYMVWIYMAVVASSIAVHARRCVQEIP